MIVCLFVKGKNKQPKTNGHGNETSYFRLYKIVFKYHSLKICSMMSGGLLVRALCSQPKGSGFESQKIANDDNNHDGLRDTA